MNNFSYSKATTVQDAVDLRQQPEAAFVAGGTNLIDLMKYGVTKAASLVDVNHVDGYHALEERPEGGIRIGAFLSNAKTAYHPEIESRYPLLSKAILAGASAQIRNMATNGGNLLQRTRCYYFYDINTPCNKREPGSGCAAITGYNRNMAILGTSEECIAVFPSDMCVALAALDATVNISGRAGDYSLPFSEFHRLPGDTPHIDNNLQDGDLLTSIDLPAQGFAKNYSYLKLRDRNSYAFALVSVATGFELADDNTILQARIALGGVAHKPWRTAEAEEFLQGRKANRENFEMAANMLVADAVGYQYNSFKIELARRAVVRNCMMALDPQSQLPGAQPSDTSR